MSWLLGTDAAFMYDINFIMQIFILFVLLMGSRFKGNKNYGAHGKTMTVALALNLALIFVVMVPSLVIYSGAFLTEPLLGAIVVLHAIFGTIAVLLAVMIIIAWRSAPAEKLGCMRRRNLMRPTIALWAVALLLGVVFYIAAFVL